MRWRYFGYTDGGGPLKVFRIPAEKYNGKFDFDLFDQLERLLPDGTWLLGWWEQAERDWMHGWFNEEDEITEADIALVPLDPNAGFPRPSSKPRAKASSPWWKLWK
jgi:hypothetical protein